MRVPEPKILKTNQWGAVPPSQAITEVGRPTDVLVHSTAGHHTEVENPRDESLEESIRYARDIQYFHMARPPQGRGWIDSGHNFLVCRNGVILVGRHKSYTRVAMGEMVESAHCPGQNHNPGVEFEHIGAELWTPAQANAGVALIAWICDRCQINPNNLYPHRRFYNTDCPSDVITARMAILRNLVRETINHWHGR